MDTKTETPQEILEAVIIRFVGDSGDGMQLTGTQFSDTSAMFGNDVATFPNYPAEIRAPQGSLYGVSGYQVHIGSVEISTPGDEVDLLVAMNPAGLKTNLHAVKPGHTIIVDTDAFTKKNLEKALYDSNPLEDNSLENYRVIEVAMTSLTKEALPVIRYRTRDLTRLLPGTARPMRRMDKITGRSDDMLIIRGVNVFPSQIEERVLAVPGLAPHYQIHVCRSGNLDKLSVHVERVIEATPAEAASFGERLAREIKDYIGIGVEVIVGDPGAVPRSEGKAVRVVDERLKPGS